jgi:dihydrodipicolinate synthase/N-acetylneuraminate lyase
MPDEKIITERDRRISNSICLLDDAIRFGCAIGSWVKSDVLWHRFGANGCIEVMAKRCAEEFETLYHEWKEREQKEIEKKEQP